MDAFQTQLAQAIATCPAPTQALLATVNMDPLSAYQRHMLCTFQMVAGICMTLLVSEYINFLPQEICMIRKSRLSPGSIALLVNRYVGLVALITGCIFALGNPSSCAAVGWIFCLTLCVQQGAASFIFYLRTRAIWNNNKIVSSVVGAGCVIVAGSYLATAFSIDYGASIPVSLTPYGGKCVVASSANIRSWRAVSSVVTLVFDTTVLVLTLTGLMGYHVKTGASAQAQKTVRTLALASLWYFIPVVALNISTAVIIFTTNPQVRAIAMAYTGTVSQIAASRLVFDMQSTFGIRDKSTEGMMSFRSNGSCSCGQDKYNLNLKDSNEQQLDANGVEMESSSSTTPKIPLAVLPYGAARTSSSTPGIEYHQEQVKSYSPSDWPASKR